MKPNARDKVLVGEILDELTIIDKRLASGKKAYDTSDILKDAIAMRLIALSELLGGLSDDFYENHTNLPTAKLRGLRNVLAHEYGAVDFERLWHIVSVDYVKLAKQLRQIAKKENIT